MAVVFNESVNGSVLPYKECLILDIPVDVQHQVRDITNFVVIPVDTLLAVLSLVANLLVSTAVLRRRALQHPSQLLLCSLSVTDILWAFNTLVNNVLKMTHEYMCPDDFPIEPGVAVLCYMSTMGSLMIISRDRYLALNRPWVYHHNNNRKGVFKKITAIWLYSTLMAVAVLISIIFQEARDINILTVILAVLTVFFYLGCVLVVMFSYIGIFVASRRHRREMHQIAAQVRSTLIREKRVTTTVTLIMLAFVFTFLPAILVPVALALASRRQSYLSMSPFYKLFVTLNGFLNPLLNFGRNKNVRKTIRKLIGCHHRNGQISPPRLS